MQEPCAPKLFPQLLVSVKYPFKMVILIMCSVVFPTFVMIVVSVLRPPTVTVPKLKSVGFSSTTVPVPVKLAVWGLPGALSVIDKVAARDPRCVGVKVTLIVQVAPGTSELPQVVFLRKSAGSAPVKLMLWIVSATVP